MPASLGSLLLTPCLEFHLGFWTNGFEYNSGHFYYSAVKVVFADLITWESDCFSVFLVEPLVAALYMNTC